MVNFRSGIIKALRERGHEVVALAPRDAHSESLKDLVSEYHQIDMDNSGSNPLKDSKLLLSVYRIYKLVKPDIVLHYTIKPNIYGTWVARWLNIPMINTVSGLGTTFLNNNVTSSVARWLYRYSFRFPQRIFFQNGEDLKEFQTLKLLTRSNYRVVPGSGVNMEQFDFTPLPDDKPIRLLMLSRLLEDKGVREFVEAAQMVIKSGVDVEFQLAGNPEIGHKRGIPPSEIAQWQQNGLVQYLGELTDVRSAIAQANIVVLPSYREGLPKSLLEAAAMGRPLITTDVAGCREVVIDEINGLLCQPRNSEDLASKIQIMIKHPIGHLQQMGLAGRKHVTDHFDEKIVISIYLEEIASILGLNEI